MLKQQGLCRLKLLLTYSLLSLFSFTGELEEERPNEIYNQQCI